jgi:hypothetical protein
MTQHERKYWSSSWVGKLSSPCVVFRAISWRSRTVSYGVLARMSSTTPAFLSGRDLLLHRQNPRSWEEWAAR